MTARNATMPFPARMKTELKLDPVLLTLVSVLLLGGLVVLASASITISDNATGNPFFYVERQLVAAALGLVAAIACLFIPMRVWQALGFPMLLLGLALLTVVLLPGVGYEVNGATRWVRFGPMNLQVSEPARLCLLIYVAGYAVRQEKALRERFVGFLRPMLVLSIACLLLLAEPDFGAAIVLLATALVMLFVAGARIRDFIVFFSTAVVAMATLALTSPYRLNRLTGFMDPWADPYNSGFQLTQSLIAIGRGQWLGVGLGDGVQKLFYLPEAHTDFIFAVLAEEAGLLGVITVLILFLLLVTRIMVIGIMAHRKGRAFQGFVAFGIGLWIGLQALVNMGVNLGVLPTKGLTLPLISSGGSSMLMTLLAIGVVLRIKYELDRDFSVYEKKRKPGRRLRK